MATVFGFGSCCVYVLCYYLFTTLSVPKCSTTITSFEFDLKYMHIASFGVKNLKYSCSLTVILDQVELLP